MLDANDIRHIKENRADITRHRLEEIVLYRKVPGRRDPFTGDIKYTEVQETVFGTWKTLISQSGGEGEIQFDNGVHVVTDDAIIDLDISINVEDVTGAKRVRTGERYVVKAKDVLGLGEPNRHYILLELVK